VLQHKYISSSWSTTCRTAVNTASQPRIQHGTLWLHLRISRNLISDPGLNVILTKYQAQTSEPECCQESSFRPLVGRTGGKKRGKQVYTAPIHNLVAMLIYPGFEATHGTEGTAKRRKLGHIVNNWAIKTDKRCVYIGPNVYFQSC
jgi:hypothetical protein